MRRKVIVLIDEAPTLCDSVVDGAKALNINPHNAYMRLHRVGTSFESYQRLKICYVEDYIKWTGRDINVPLSKKKTFTVLENKVELVYCNEGCGQLLRYCLCNKFNDVIKGLNEKIINYGLEL